jgi:hypothetical protein
LRKPVIAVAVAGQPPRWHLLDYAATLIVAQALG